MLGRTFFRLKIVSDIRRSKQIFCSVLTAFLCVLYIPSVYAPHSVHPNIRRNESGSYVSVVNRLRAERSKNRCSNPGEIADFLFATASRPALGLTQPSVRFISAVLTHGQSDREMTQTTHLRLIPKFKRDWSNASAVMQKSIVGDNTNCSCSMLAYTL